MLSRTLRSFKGVRNSLKRVGGSFPWQITITARAFMPEPESSSSSESSSPGKITCREWRTTLYAALRHMTRRRIGLLMIEAVIRMGVRADDPATAGFGRWDEDEPEGR
jgi:hypothetical protein